MTSRVRLLSLLLLLSASSAAYYYTQHLSNRNPPPVAVAKAPNATPLAQLDEAVLAQIRPYFDGVVLNAGEDNLGVAMHLDSSEGRPALSRGDDRNAYDIYRKVLAISYRQGSLQGIGVALGILSQIENRMGRSDEALKLVGLQYAVAQAIGDRFETGVVEMQLANFLQQSDPALSVKMRLRALQSLKGTPYVQDYIDLLSSLSMNGEVAARPAVAMHLAQEAWSLVSQSGDRPDLASARATAAKQYAKLLSAAGKSSDAIAVLQQAATLYPIQNRNTDTYYDLLTLLADNYTATGQREAAKEYYASAYSRYENNRLNALGDDARARLDNEKSVLVNHYIDLLNSAQNPQDALALLEANKARTLSDISDDVGQQQAYQQLTSLKREHARQRLALFQRSQDEAGNRDVNYLLPGAEQRWKKLWTDEEALQQRQDSEMWQLQQRLQLRNLTAATAFNVDKLRRLQRALPGDVAAIALFAGDTGLGVYLLTDTELRYIPTGLQPLRYQREVEKLRAALLNPAIDFYREPALLLGDMLLRPVLAQLPKHIKRLIYSPDGPFVNLPLGILMPDGNFLAQRYSVLRVPSLGVLDDGMISIAHGTAGISCVDPAVYGRRLPFQQATGKHLESLYSARIKALSGTDCSIERLEAALTGLTTPAFLHIGAHGFFYPGEAMQSGILLTSKQRENQGVLWDAQAIASVDLSRVPLVTLSSCETGLSDQDRQRDVFGLLRALLFGGAHQILAPLWSVQDEATHRLMSAFFDAYRNGADAAGALLKAQQQLIADKRYAHPFYWSGFVLTGDAL